jgi:soluble lytic murein transglycosylase
LRESGYALPAGKPESNDDLLWSLAYPMAHAQAIRPAAEEFRLPPSLLFGLAREESAFEAEVVSWAGAIGLCQLMPFTAKEEAERLRVALPSLDALRKPRLNARLGAAHLSRRMSLGHPLLAIAAYNAGPGNVNKWRKAYPNLPLDAFVESIPVEQTRNYVKKVTGSWVVYTWMNPEKASHRVEYTLDLPPR